MPGRGATGRPDGGPQVFAAVEFLGLLVALVAGLRAIGAVVDYLVGRHQVIRA